MDLSAAITNGYNIGKDLGYNLSGQAAEDRRLNREMTRAKIDTMQAQADLAQQQAQYARDDREEQEKMKAYEGVMTLATQAVNNPLMKSQTLKAIQDMQQRFGYSNEWVITDALDDDLRDPEKFNTASMLAYTVHGKGTNPLDEQNAEDFQRVQQGIVKMTNTQTGETQYTHIGDLLYMFGGNYGTAYMHSVIQAKKLKEEAEREKERQEALYKQSQMQRNQTQNAKDIFEMRQNAENAERAKQTSGIIASQWAQNPDRSVSTDSKGNFTSIGATPKEGSAQDNAANLKQMNDNSNLVRQVGKIYNNTYGTQNAITTQDVDQLIEETKTLASQGHNDAQRNASLNKLAEDLSNAELDLRTIYYENPDTEKGQKALQLADYISGRYKDIDAKFGASASQDKKTAETIGLANSIRNLSKNPYGIGNTLQLAAQSYSTLVDKDFMEKIQSRINNKTLNVRALANLFNGRMTNKIWSELSDLNNWKDFSENAQQLTEVFDQCANDIEALLSTASYGQKAQMQIAARQFRDAASNLRQITITKAAIQNGPSDPSLKVLTSDNTTKPLDLLAATQQQDVIYFDYNNNKVHILPQSKNNSINMDAGIDMAEFAKSDLNPNVSTTKSVFNPTWIADRWSGNRVWDAYLKR